MHLTDMQILDPDRPLFACFSDIGKKDIPEDITLRHLLSHTSGLVDPPTLESDLEAGKAFPEVIRNAKRAPAGLSFHYSNLGFGLIGCVLESLLSKPLGTVFREYLFDPLRMNATLEGCSLPQEQIMPVTRVLPYRKGRDLVLTPLGRRPLLTPDPLRHYGHTAGSMYTDIESLLTLLSVLADRDNPFLSEASRAEIKSEHAHYGALSPTLSYGLGLLIIRDPSLSGGRILGHQGFAYGCADGAFIEESTGRMMISLNGGCSEARTGRLGLANRDLLRWAFRKELPAW